MSSNEFNSFAQSASVTPTDSANTIDKLTLADLEDRWLALSARLEAVGV